MKTTQSASISLAVGLLALSLFPSVAHAVRGDGVGPATIRQELRASTIKIEGTLSCNLGEKNEGGACTLKFQDSKSGKSYDLSNANDAMRLYMSGSKNVAIEGTFSNNSNGESIQISQVNAL